MSEHIIRLNKVLRELNISLEVACNFLKSKNIVIDVNPNVKISNAEFRILYNEFCEENMTENTPLPPESNCNKPSEINYQESSTKFNYHSDSIVWDQKGRTTIRTDLHNNIEYIHNEYSRSKMLIDNIIRAKSHFETQYGNDELIQIKNATLNSISTKLLYISLENKYWPTANAILKSVTQVDYIIINTYYHLKTSKAIEKKLDFLNIAAILILEDWLFNLLPYQEKNPVKSSANMSIVQSGWMMGELIWLKIFEACEELGKQIN